MYKSVWSHKSVCLSHIFNRLPQSVMHVRRQAHTHTHTHKHTHTRTHTHTHTHTCTHAHTCSIILVRTSYRPPLFYIRLIICPNSTPNPNHHPHKNMIQLFMILTSDVWHTTLCSTCFTILVRTCFNREDILDLTDIAKPVHICTHTHTHPQYFCRTLIFPHRGCV